MRNKKTIGLLLGLFLVAIMIIAVPVTVFANSDSEPGTVNLQSPKDDALTTPEALASPTALQPVVTETGHISLSLDALGIKDNVTGTIQVDKPAGATVRSAYMTAADVWGSSGKNLPDGAIKLNGVGVKWARHVKLSAPSGGPYHAWADVTSIVKPVVDAAPTGIVNLNVIETMYLDGSILAVIFDDPNQKDTNTVVLLFGAQNTAGDTFNILLAKPIDKTNPNLGMDFSLGISYSYQKNGGGQYSIVDVNGKRLTTSAGGEDDGYSENGGLITVGGIGDSNTNPVNPNATPLNPRTDDELYTILDFVYNGDTNIKIDTKNPSNDDSIFVAGLFIKSAIAVIGEGIVLEPPEATNEVGVEHTVTATVQNNNGNPVVGRDVTFKIVSGPHEGLQKAVPTDKNGKVSFTYTGKSVGTDVIIASFVNLAGETITSNRVIKKWITPQPETVVEAGKKCGPPGAEIKVPITIQNANGMAGAQFDLSYDPKVAVATAVEKGDLVKDFILTPNLNEAANGLVRIALAGTNGVQGDGTLVVVTFKLTGKMGDKTPLKILNLELNDEKGNPIKAAVKDGEVGICLTCGDVNGDEKVSAADATLTLRAAVGLQKLTYEQICAANVNCDQKITAADVTLILRKAVGLVKEINCCCII